MAKPAKVVATVDDDAGPQWGPAMGALPAEHRRFVVEQFMPGAKASRSFKLAGLSTGMTELAIRSAASRLAHSAPIVAATIEWARSHIETIAPQMVHKMQRLALAGKSEETQRKSASRLLELAGLNPPVQVAVEHTHTLTFAEKITELMRLAALAGDDPQTAIAGLSPPGPIIEHEADSPTRTIRLVAETCIEG